MKAVLGFVAYLIITLCIFIACTVECYYWTQESETLLLYPTSFMNQVTQDWDFAPYTSFVATNNTFCPANAPEIAIGRRFYGTDLGCDCLGIFS